MCAEPSASLCYKLDIVPMFLPFLRKIWRQNNEKNYPKTEGICLLCEYPAPRFPTQQCSFRRLKRKSNFLIYYSSNWLFQEMFIWEWQMMACAVTVTVMAMAMECSVHIISVRKSCFWNITSGMVHFVRVRVIYLFARLLAGSPYCAEHNCGMKNYRRLLVVNGYGVNERFE